MDQGICENDLEVSDAHSNIIVHIDVDCFYAQVEMLRNPKFRNVPLGIQQKNIIVTSNYVARKYGIKKCMLVVDGLKICPNLTLVKGEDLQDYRRMSNKIFSTLQKFNCPVEKLGMDENFIDVTELINERIKATNGEISVAGKVYRTSEIECYCGCHLKLRLASHIAQEIRNKLFDELGLTCSAGIAHNKLLAKLVGTVNKPNDQTTVYPEHASTLVSLLSSVRLIPGIGVKTAETLQTLNIRTVNDLQNAEISFLTRTFSSDIAVRLKNLSLGIDRSEVKQSGKPSSIGLEDSFKMVNVQSKVEEKFSALLSRLALLVREDGRIPVSMRVTLRKKDARRMCSHRETRQCQISPSIFVISDGNVTLPASGHQKLMVVIMRLFNKLIDLTKPFHLTLVGLAFTKFQERMSGRSSIVSYFMNDLSVHSILSLQNDCEASVSSMECSLASPGDSTNTDVSEGEVEPSPKKVKRVPWIAKKRCFSQVDCASPSKLRVADLRLNSRELDRVSELKLNSRDYDASSTSSASLNDNRNQELTNLIGMDCPTDVDKEVFKALPEDVREELRALWKSQNQSINAVIKGNQNSDSKSKPNTILRYFIPNK